MLLTRKVFSRMRMHNESIRQVKGQNVPRVIIRPAGSTQIPFSPIHRRHSSPYPEKHKIHLYLLDLRSSRCQVSIWISTGVTEWYLQQLHVYTPERHSSLYINLQVGIISND